MRRAVQTANIALATYPNSLRWHLMPELREALNSQSDVGYYSLEYLQQFKHIDSSVLADDRLWFMRAYDDSPLSRHGSRLIERHR